MKENTNTREHKKTIKSGKPFPHISHLKLNQENCSIKKSFSFNSLCYRATFPRVFLILCFIIFMFFIFRAFFLQRKSPHYVDFIRPPIPLINYVISSAISYIFYVCTYIHWKNKTTYSVHLQYFNLIVQYEWKYKFLSNFFSQS